MNTEFFSTESEIFIITGISNLSLLVYNTFPYNNLIFDFIIWILPQYFIIIYPENKRDILILLFNLLDFSKLQIKQKRNINKLNYSIIGILRSYISLQVAICILAVDFINIYPNKFGKSISYGLKLMDVGVGSYLYNGGIMSSKIKYKGIINLVLLGALRLGFINYFKLEVDVREYGKHSNFYFILAGVFFIYKMINVGGNYLRSIKYLRNEYLSRNINSENNNSENNNSENINSRNIKSGNIKSRNTKSRNINVDILNGRRINSSHFGYLILFIYYFITKYYKIDKLILSENGSNFFLQNKESFFVILPFVCILLIMQDIKKILFYAGKNINLNIKMKILELVKYTSLFYILYKISEKYDLPSRRLGNPSYIFFILYVHTFHLLIYIFICLISKMKNYKSVDFCSRNMMTNFLLTNLIVLFLKKSINLSEWNIHLIMMIYLFVSFIVPPCIF